MTEDREHPDRTAGQYLIALRRRAVHVLLAAWLLGISVFYFIRFTSIVYASNQDALERLFESFLN